MAESKKVLVTLEVDDSALSAAFKDAQSKAKLFKQTAGDVMVGNMKNFAAMQKKQQQVDSVWAKEQQKISNNKIKAAEKEAKIRKQSWDANLKVAKNMAGLVAGMTKEMLKWVTYAGSIAGLLTGAGVFGMDRLARGLASSQRTASGMLTNQNVLKAARVNFGQIVDVDSITSKIAAAKIDPAQRHLLAMYGVDPTRSVESILPELLTKAQSYAKLGGSNAGQDPRLNQLFSTDDIARLQQSKNIQTQQYETDVRTLQLSQQQTQSWIELNKQIDRAKYSIENAFVESLTPLAPQFTQLSNEIVKAIRAFLGTDTVKGWILSLASALEELVNWFKSGAYKSTMNNLIAMLDQFGGAVMAAGNVLNSIFGGGFTFTQQQKLKDINSIAGSTLGNSIKNELSNIVGNLGNTPEEKRKREQANYNIRKDIQDLSQDKQDAILKATGDIIGISRGTYKYGGSGGSGVQSAYPKGMGNYSASFAATEAKYGLKSGTLAAIANQESSGNPGAVSGAGAVGLMQFMPKTAAGYGIDPANPYASINAAGQMMSQLLKHYKGNMQRALAAYNWGQGNVDAAINKYGANWMQHAPSETRGYVPRIMLNINNAAGADYNTSVHQAGMQP